VFLHRNYDIHPAVQLARSEEIRLPFDFEGIGTEGQRATSRLWYADLQIADVQFLRQGEKRQDFKLTYTYSVRKDDNETVFPDHHALLDGEAKYPTERWKSSSISDSGRKFRVPTLDVLSIPNPQTFCTPNGQQGTAIASYWNNARSGQ
jgi:hypothetical protein